MSRRPPAASVWKESEAPDKVTVSPLLPIISISAALGNPPAAEAAPSFHICARSALSRLNVPPPSLFITIGKPEVGPSTAR